MTRPNDLMRYAVETLIVHGFNPIITNGGKHPKIQWTDNNGRHRVLVIARSPSDHRTRANSRATLRRLLRTTEERARS